MKTLHSSSKKTIQFYAHQNDFMQTKILFSFLSKLFHKNSTDEKRLHGHLPVTQECEFQTTLVLQALKRDVSDSPLLSVSETRSQLLLPEHVTAIFSRPASVKHWVRLTEFKSNSQ
jgi:hypothetical protein